MAYTVEDIVKMMEMDDGEGDSSDDLGMDIGSSDEDMQDYYRSM